MTASEIVNQSQIGNVDIELVEYQVDTSTGMEIPYSHGRRLVMPNETVSKIPRITNVGEPCYIRVQIQIIDPNGYLQEENLIEFPDNWIQGSDGYWYLPEMLLEQDQIDVFHKIHIPYDLPQAIYEGQNFEILIIVEAIQAFHFIPEYESNLPWGEVQLLDCEQEGDVFLYAVSPVETGDYMDVRWQYFILLIVSCCCMGILHLLRRRKT